MERISRNDLHKIEISVVTNKPQNALVVFE